MFKKYIIHIFSFPPSRLKIVQSNISPDKEDQLEGNTGEGPQIENSSKSKDEKDQLEGKSGDGEIGILRDQSSIIAMVIGSVCLGK